MTCAKEGWHGLEGRQTSVRIFDRGVVKRSKTLGFDPSIRRFESFLLCHVTALAVRSLQTNFGRAPTGASLNRLLASIAQLVERQPEKLCVAGSTPALGTKPKSSPLGGARHLQRPDSSVGRALPWYGRGSQVRDLLPAPNAHQRTFLGRMPGFPAPQWQAGAVKPLQPCSVRLVDQDIALSRREHGFEFRTERHFPLNAAFV